MAKYIAVSEQTGFAAGSDGKIWVFPEPRDDPSQKFFELPGDGTDQFFLVDVPPWPGQGFAIAQGSAPDDTNGVWFYPEVGIPSGGYDKSKMLSAYRFPKAPNLPDEAPSVPLTREEAGDMIRALLERIGHSATQGVFRFFGETDFD